MSSFLLRGFKMIIGFGSLVLGVVVYFQAGMFINIATSLMDNPNVQLNSGEGLENTVSTFEGIRSKSIILIIMGFILSLETTLRSFMSNFKPPESKKDYER